MRIVIDLQSCQGMSRYRGIGRYSMAISKAIIRQASKHEVILLLNGDFRESIDSIRREFDGILPPQFIKVFHATPGRSWTNPTELWKTGVAEMIREKFILSLDPDVVLVSSLFEGFSSNEIISISNADLAARTAVIHYDLIPLLRPDLYLRSADAVAYNKRKIKYLKNSAKLLAISEYSKTEALDHLEISGDKVSVILAAVDPKFEPIVVSQNQTREIRLRYGIRGSMVLYAPGGFDPRKNFETLIEAYGKLPLVVRETRQLVIVGKLPSADTAKRLNDLAFKDGLVAGELVITDYIPEEELVKFYNLAELFVFPSIHEGFGLPPLEAMACGIPVIASNGTSLAEVIGLNEALFPPNDSDCLASLMGRALSDMKFSQLLRTHSLKRAGEFSWQRSARLALESLESLGNRHVRSQHESENSTKFDCGALIQQIAMSWNRDLLVDDGTLMKIASDIEACVRVLNPTFQCPAFPAIMDR